MLVRYRRDGDRLVATATEHRIVLPDWLDDATGTYLEPLACVLRGAEKVPSEDPLSMTSYEPAELTGLTRIESFPEVP